MNIIDLYPPIKRPKLKRPAALRNTDVTDVANVALIVDLLLANVAMTEPQSLVWWATRCVPSDVAEAFRSVVAANPKLLKLEDGSGETPALYMVRCDCHQVATLYLDESNPLNARPSHPEAGK